MFIEHGPGAPLDEIARRAGTGIATLYRRFPDRRTLMRDVVLDAMQRTAEEARWAAWEEPDPFRAVAQPSEKTLREALAPVTATATQVMDDFRGRGRRPEEIEISFGVTLDGKLGGVIASDNAGAHLDVTLRWRAPGPARDDGSPGDP